MTGRPLIWPGLLILILLLICRSRPLPEAAEQAGVSREWIGRVIETRRSAAAVTYRLRELQTSRDYLVSYPIQSNSKSTNFKLHTEALPWKVGWLIRIRGELRAYSIPGNPGEFDLRRSDYSRGISGRIRAQSTVILQQKTDYQRQLLADLKHSIKQRFSERLPADQAGIINAMLLGDSSGLEEADKRGFRLTGTAHILAVSGLHVSIIGHGIFRLLKKIIAVRPSACISIGLVYLYALLVGEGYGISRAALMFALQQGALLTGRRYDPPTALAAAAVTTVLRQPYCVYNTGFLLSYAAVLAILSIPPWRGRRHVIKPLKWRDLKPKALVVRLGQRCRIKLLLLPAQLYAGLWLYLWLMPLQQHLFANSSYWTAVLNLLVIPLGGAALLAACMSLPLLWLPAGLTAWLFGLLQLLLGLLQLLTTGGSRLPGRFIGGIGGGRFVLLLILLAAVRQWVSNDRRERSVLHGWLIVSGLLIGLMLVRPFGRHLSAESLVYSMLDVGQGDCNLFYSGSGAVVMIDCGSSTKSAVGEQVVAKVLFELGVSHIDLLFLTHPDTDHTNGVKGLLAAGIDIGRVYVPPAFGTTESGAGLLAWLTENDCSWSYAESGNSWRLSGRQELFFSCLAAGTKAVKDGNAMSLVLEVSYGEFSALLTGDLPGEEEKKLFQNRQQTSYTVLKTAHHGSRSSTGSLFLERCRFVWAGISVGSENSYGHPAQAVLDRLAEADIRTLRTDRQGAIDFSTNGRSVKVSVFGKQ